MPQPEAHQQPIARGAPPGPRGRLRPWPLTGLLLAALGFWLFGTIAAEFHEHPGTWLDARFTRFGETVRDAGLAGMFAVLTWAGDTLVVVPLGLAAALLLAVRFRTWVPPVLVAIASAGIGVLVGVLKNGISRPRPNPAAAVVEESGFGFPSGHSANSAAVYLLLAVVSALLLRDRSRRDPTRDRHAALWSVLVIGAVLVVLAVGLSRVVLGVHAATDVLAGWALGTSWCLVLASLWRWGRAVRSPGG
ncbi:phosphatase PAP2 family protein [Saccharopolyspora sp. CA-218241]|uniref:phosphatase PAP2 family protein n=1 Tax=Saccharopolyspora sp. CA-218241 TaxID=3240027 RepID=UPI003D989056